MTFINKCWKLPHQSKPWCVNACLPCEKLSGLYLQDTQVIKRRDPKHVNFTVITGTQGGQITHFQPSPGDLHCRLKMPEIKLIINFLKSGPLPAPFLIVSGVQQRVTLALLFSRQNITRQPKPIRSTFIISTLSSASFAVPLSPPESTLGFLNLGTADVLGQVIVCCRGCSVHCRLF